MKPIKTILKQKGNIELQRWEYPAYFVYEVAKINKKGLLKRFYHHYKKGLGWHKKHCGETFTDVYANALKLYKKAVKQRKKK